MRGHGNTREARQRQIAAQAHARRRATEVSSAKGHLTRRLRRQKVSLPTLNLPPEREA